MVDVRGDVLRPPHGTTPAAVNSNKNQKWELFNEHIFEKRAPTMTLGVIFNKRGFWRYLLCWELIKVLLQTLNVKQ